MSRLIGWRTLKSMKKQHLTLCAYTEDGIFYCIGRSKSDTKLTGWVVNIIKKADLLINKELPKCKKCLKEEVRITNLEGQIEMKKFNNLFKRKKEILEVTSLFEKKTNEQIEELKTKIENTYRGLTNAVQIPILKFSGIEEKFIN